MSEIEKSELVSLAKKCFKNGQFVSVITHMKEVIKLEIPLNYFERILIYNSLCYLQLPFINILSDIKIHEKIHSDIINNIKEALCNLCNDAIYFLDDSSSEKDNSKEAIAHYKCFKSIQYCCLVNYTQNISNEDDKNKALKLYKEATEIANEYLNPAHPVRLFIAYYFSKHNSCLLNNDNKAFEISKKACEKGLECLPELAESLKKSAEFQLECLQMFIDNYSYL